MIRHFVAVVFAAGVISDVSHAATVGLEVGPNVSTLGVGPTINFHQDHSIWGLRVEADFFRFSKGVTLNDVRYDGHLKMLSGGVAAELYPLRSGLRISAGLKINGNKAILHARPAHDIILGDITYSASDLGSLHGQAYYNKVNPLMSIGYDHAFGPIALSLDLGAIYEGRGTLTTSSFGGALSDTFGLNVSLNRYIAEARHDMRYGLFYPLLQLGVAYRF